MKRILPVALLALTLMGCTSTNITNLTPSREPRNVNGLYSFQMAWKSNQRSIRKDTIRPFVIVGMDVYPMEPTPLVKNRWETLIPVPAGKNVLNYRFKVDYEYDSIPIRRPDSKLSPPYQLEIMENR
ncbi:MAG TPA: hypothetical protein VHH73_19685 [Verrucomicrobiae bacterium]|nr:hypothetical protein [Verrucomicrobiae bacterium]